jgi:tetratricopeptide (TPR) repeat protein
MNQCSWWAALVGLLLLPGVAISADPAKEALAKGKACVEKKDYDAAIAAFTEAIRLDPKCAEAYCRRGWTYTRKNDLARALADCSEAIRLDSTLVLAHSIRGWTYGAMGDQEKAIAECSQAISLDPN